MAEIIVYKGTEGFEKLESIWDTLVENGITKTPFQLSDYQQSWWQHMRPDNAELFILAVSEADAVIGILPLFLRDGVFEFNTSFQETDYLDVITSAENAQTVWASALEWLMGANSPEWTALDFQNIAEWSSSLEILPQLAESHGLAFEREVAEVCPVIQLPDSYETYLAELDKKQRHEVKRKGRRAKGAEAELVQVTEAEDVESAVNDFLDLLQKSTPDKKAWLEEFDGRRKLFYDVAKSAFDKGILQLLFIEVEGQRAAALFNIDYNDRIWVYNSGLDPDAFGGLSLGVVVTAKAIEIAANNGRSTFDFMRGDEQYKYRFGAKDTTIYRLQLKK